MRKICRFCAILIKGLFVMEYENIGMLLKALRDYLDLSFAAFGNPIGISQTNINRFEKGEYIF